MEEEVEEQEEDICIKTFRSTPSFKQYRDCQLFQLQTQIFISRNNLPKIKDGTYVISLYDKNSKGTHWVALFANKNTAVYSDSFGIEYIPQEVLKRIKDKSITRNIFRIQDNDSIMCGFYCAAFVEYMLAEKSLLDYTTFFSLNDYKINDKITHKCFKDKYGTRSNSRVQIKKN